jgi:hypothetical protein
MTDAANNGLPAEGSSPACAMHQADDVYMGYAGRRDPGLIQSRQLGAWKARLMEDPRQVMPTYLGRPGRGLSAMTMQRAGAAADMPLSAKILKVCCCFRLMGAGAAYDRH